MNTVAKIHQFYLDRIAEALPYHRRLSNPYKPEENPNIILRQGFGVTIGSASTAKRTNQPMLTINRTFSVVLTREYVAREDDGPAKAVVEKNLMLDAAAIAAEIEANWSMDGLILRSRFTGDTGIEYVTTETDRFLKTVIDFEVEYFAGGDNDC